MLAVWDLETDRLSGFIGSTVPNEKAVQYFHNLYSRQPRPPQSKWAGNLLPTGYYGYIVGTHQTRSSRVPGAFLLRERLNKRRTVTVLRSGNDAAYGKRDIFHPCRPGDNIHPGFGDHRFSSWGCLTVRGTYARGEHRGEWKLFRAAAGVGVDLHEGDAVDVLLITGLEAAIATTFSQSGFTEESGIVQEQLCRLRQGSTDVRVAQLRGQLGVSAGSVFDAETAKALADLQQGQLGSGDGVYAPDMDTLLGWSIFGGIA